MASEDTLEEDDAKNLRAEELVEAHLNAREYQEVERTGWERKYGTWVKDTVIKSYGDDAGFAYLRLMPDFHVFHRNNRFWVDAKSGWCISREAYDHYMMLDKKHPCYVAFVTGDSIESIMISRVSDLRFQTDEWQTKTSSAGASGKPYKCIDKFRTPIVPADRWNP